MKPPKRGAPKGNQRARKHSEPLKTISPRITQEAYESLQRQAEALNLGVTTLAAQILTAAAKI